MQKGAWNLGLLSKHRKMIDTCVYQGKRYALYLDYDNMMILVNITDMWYIYIDEYLLEHLEITDDLIYTIEGDPEWQ